MSTIIERNNFLPHINSRHRNLEAFRLLSSQAFLFVTCVPFQCFFDSLNFCCRECVCVCGLSANREIRIEKREKISQKKNICMISFIIMLQQAAHVRLSSESKTVQVHNVANIALSQQHFCMWSWAAEKRKATALNLSIFFFFCLHFEFYTKVKQLMWFRFKPSKKK